MEQFIEFALNHWLLWTAFIILLLLVLQLELRSQVGSVKLLSPPEAVALINREHATVIDVRPETAFEQGHILNAIHIPVGEVEQKLKKLQKYKKKPLIISCSNGQHAPKIGAMLHKQGFEQLFSLKGGMQAWQSASLPLVK